MRYFFPGMTRLQCARRRRSVAGFLLSACALLTLLVSGASTTHDHTHGVGLYNSGCSLLALAALALWDPTASPWSVGERAVVMFAPEAAHLIPEAR